MNHEHDNQAHFAAWTRTDEFVCVFGKRVVEKDNYTYLTIPEPMHSPGAAHLACEGLYHFMSKKMVGQIGQAGRLSPDHFASFVLSFPNEQFADEVAAAESLFTLLVAMHAYDRAKGYGWALGVSNDPRSKDFSFSIGGEAWFCPFFYPGATMPARRSPHTMLVMNSHRLFEALRIKGKYESTREVVRAAEMKQFGLVPELLSDFGQGLEFPQYLLPHHENLGMVWKILSQVGGNEPFGPIIK